MHGKVRKVKYHKVNQLVGDWVPRAVNLAPVSD